MKNLPFYGRLSTYYFLYYALLGVLVPYWALFLQARGFVTWQIGLLLATPYVTKLGAPNIGRRLGFRRCGRGSFMGNLAAAHFLFCGNGCCDSNSSTMAVLPKSRAI